MQSTGITIFVLALPLYNFCSNGFPFKLNTNRKEGDFFQSYEYLRLILLSCKSFMLEFFGPRTRKAKFKLLSISNDLIKSSV
jgi:hypothetical protein